MTLPALRLLLRTAGATLACGAALALPPTSTRAQDTPRFSEYQIKAGFIYNFAKLVEWPAGAPAAPAITVCLVGDDPFGPAREALETKTVGEQRIELRRVQATDDLKACRIAFISASQAAGLTQILDRVRELPVLTIGDTPGFAERGVIVNFYVADDKVRFEVNVDAAKRARLQFGARLLNLARLVHDPGHGHD